MFEITQTAFSIMLAHCQSVYPLEACGFLGGADGKAFMVTVVKNILQSPVAYEMDPRQQLDFMLYVEEHSLEIVAAYHSHPHGPSKPSPTDLAQAYYPDLPQIIISLRSRSFPRARAFLLMPDKFRELDFHVV